MSESFTIYNYLNHYLSSSSIVSLSTGTQHILSDDTLTLVFQRQPVLSYQRDIPFCLSGPSKSLHGSLETPDEHSVCLVKKVSSTKYEETGLLRLTSLLRSPFSSLSTIPLPTMPYLGFPVLHFSSFP